MRMYRWTVTNPGHDGDLEAGIVYHEYAHGISTRLTGGPANSNCLGYGEAGGMGEGWGDFFATLLRMKPGYNSTMDFGMGNYSAGRGIRPYPYSVNMVTNPLTYGWNNRANYREVHAKGAIWATILVDVYWMFVDKYGLDLDWYAIQTTDSKKLAGNLIMLQLVVDGMKLQPCRPDFVSARDAIIEADEANYEGAHVCLLWKGFAKRGLGVSADARKVAEAFDVPTECL